MAQDRIESHFSSSTGWTPCLVWWIDGSAPKGLPGLSAVVPQQYLHATARIAERRNEDRCRTASKAMGSWKIGRKKDISSRKLHVSSAVDQCTHNVNKALASASPITPLSIGSLTPLLGVFPPSSLPIVPLEPVVGIDSSGPSSASSTLRNVSGL